MLIAWTGTGRERKHHNKNGQSPMALFSVPLEYLLSKRDFFRFESGNPATRVEAKRRFHVTTRLMVPHMKCRTRSKTFVVTDMLSGLLHKIWILMQKKISCHQQLSEIFRSEPGPILFGDRLPLSFASLKIWVSKQRKISCHHDFSNPGQLFRDKLPLVCFFECPRVRLSDVFP